MARALPYLLSALVAAPSSIGCGPTSTPPAFPDRQPGERAPLSAMCDAADPTRCVLPWPSNTFTVVDPARATGLRVSLDPRSLPSRDDVSYLNLADGFSRLSPVMTALPGAVAAESLGAGEGGALRLIVAQPGAADEGAAIPLRYQVIPSTHPTKGEESLLIGYPLRPLAAASDHVAVLLDGVRAADGSAFQADRTTRIALGLEVPADDSERQLAAYHAPNRAVLERAGIDLERVLRVWDFTTRSSADARRRLESMRTQQLAAIDRGEVGVVLDSVETPATGSVAAVVEGRLTGLPAFRNADGVLALGEDGLPVPAGVHDAPFRVMVPRGTGSYRVVLFGHGTGGNVHDDTFDEQIAAAGLGKAGGLFYGWDDVNVATTLLGLEAVQLGVARSTAGLTQALADVSAIEHALNGALGDALAAPMLRDVANPAAGRRPDAAEPIWTGGSLGGTLGLVYSGLSPRVRYAVLNVPGAGWTHFIPGSELFSLLGPSLQANYGSALDFWLTLMASQLAWDDVDGGNWTDGLAEDGSVYLVQESIGDPILPNPGSELCAAAVGALHLGEVLRPVTGLTAASSAEGKSALTQYEVPATEDGLDRHGFANRGTPAGQAAREQISGFLTSALAGQPRIELPVLCRENAVPDSCDFSAWTP